jgi:hypothetical protein
MPATTMRVCDGVRFAVAMCRKWQHHGACKVLLGFSVGPIVWDKCDDDAADRRLRWAQSPSL